MKYFRLIWKNVFRKKTRTFLTTSSIVLVLVLIVILTSLLQAMEADPSGGRGANRLVVQHATGLGNFLPLSLLQRIEQIPGVTAVTPETWFGGVYKDDKPENWIGQLSANPEIYFDRIFDDAKIDPAVNAEWKATRNGFVAGQVIADRFKWKKGDHIILKGTYIPIDLDLIYIGSYNAGDESNVFFHNEYLNQADWFGANKVTGIYYLKVDSGESVPRVAAAIDAMFENSDSPTKTLTEKQFQLQFMEMMGNVKLLINMISLVILFAVTLIVANTVAMSARERVTEIAVMRTLGFGRGHILGFILSEAVLMSLLGGVLGVVLAKYFFIPGLVAATNKTAVAIWLTNFRVSPQTLALAFAVSVGVGILAGFIPAIRSSRLRIVDGLRQVV
jgi:putative ABC transport system permease protein